MESTLSYRESLALTRHTPSPFILFEFLLPLNETEQSLLAIDEAMLDRLILVMGSVSIAREYSWLSVDSRILLQSTSSDCMSSTDREGILDYSVVTICNPKSNSIALLVYHL